MIRVRVNSMGKARSTKTSNDVPEVPPPNLHGRAARLAFTIAPFLIYLLAEHITLPGIDADALKGAGGSSETCSIVALGITPWITAAFVVEVGAVIVPWWRHFRHGGVVGRAKLQRATNILGLLFAAFQAYSMAASLQSSKFTTHAGILPVLMMLVTLLAGTTLTKLLAEFVSRRGLANGYAVFWVGASSLGTLRAIVDHVQIVPPMDIVGVFGKIIACGLLTWFILARLRSSQNVAGSEYTSRETRNGSDTDNPYAAPNEQHSTQRADGSRVESVVPQLPTVASGMLPYAFVMTLLVGPEMFHDSIPGMAMVKAWLHSGKTSGLASLSLLFASTWICTRIFNQPKRVAKVYARIPNSTAREAQIAGEAQEASRHAFLHAAFFLAGLMVIDVATRKLTTLELGTENIAFAVVLLLDVAKEFRTLGSRRDLVSVWPEHRPYALEAARRALAVEGIFLHVRDEHQKRLFQFTVPYIPMEMCVPHSDAKRATKIFQDVLLENPANAEQQIVQPLVVAKRRPLQTWVLALIALFSVGTVMLSWPVAKPAVARGPRTTKLEFALVDDVHSIVEMSTEPSLETQYNLRFASEQVSLGEGRNDVRKYAYVELSDGETLESARQRMEAWIKSLKLPDGVRIAIGDYPIYDEQLGKVVVAGWRTYLLKGSAILTEAEVAHAQAMPDPNRGMIGWIVRLEFTDDGAQRFEKVTGENIKRRLAIMLDGRVQSAPVIQAKIPGGIATITMGNGEPEQQRLDAMNLEKALNGY